VRLLVVLALGSLVGCQFDGSGPAWGEVDGGTASDAFAAPDSESPDSVVVDSAVADGGSASCGDGVLDDDETCDDGNTNPADGVDDFCGAHCQTNSWPCGKWPGYIQPTSSTAWVEFGNTVVAGSPSGYAVVTPGDSFSVSGTYDYDKQESGCSWCTVQLYWGLYPGEPANPSDSDAAADWQVCVANADVNGEENYQFEMNAPRKMGTYYLRWDQSWSFYCTEMDIPSADRNLAVVCVLRPEPGSAIRTKSTQRARPVAPSSRGL